MSSARGLAAWGRAAWRRGALIDAIAAAALTCGAVWAAWTLPSDRWVPGTIAAAVVCTSAVAWRRRAPLPAAAVALTAIVVYQRAGQDSQGSFVTAAIVLTCYSVGRLGADAGRRRQLGAVLGYALAACIAIDAGTGVSLFGVLLTWIPVAVLPAGAGLVVERRERLIQELLVAECRLRDAQAVRTARLLAEERTRLARELHDVVAHCVSVMVIQAGAARLVAGSDVTAARQALTAVVSSGRHALADLRRVVGVLRRGNGEFGPALGLSQIDALLDGLRSGGLQVRYRVDGEPVELPPDLDLTAFRIVQEALTNVVKHAPGARADVTVAYDKQGIDLRIEDSGPAGPAATATTTGHGLVGMRERVALHAGEVRAGPTAGGGFVVRARLPLTASVTQPACETAGAQSVADDSSHPWRRLTPQAMDAVFACAWLAAFEIEALTSSQRAGPLAANVVAVAAMALVGVIRRRAPLAFLAVIGALTIGLSGGLAAPGRPSLFGAYTLFVGGYTIASYQPRLRAHAGLVFLLAGVVVTAAVQRAPAGVAVGGALMALLSWLFGRLMRRLRELTAALEEATARLAAGREDRAALALYEERARIARDLHTLVARQVTAMVVQSRAAGQLVGAADTGWVEAIGAIEQTGRQALAQLRQMLGVLRNERGRGLMQAEPGVATVPVFSAALEPVS